MNSHDPNALRLLLEDVREYLDDKADVDDGHPNKAMSLLGRVDEALDAAIDEALSDGHLTSDERARIRAGAQEQIDQGARVLAAVAATEKDR